MVLHPSIVCGLLADNPHFRRDVALAREALGPGIEESDPPGSRLTAEEIRSRTAEYWGTTVDALVSKRRTKTLTVPRQVAMYLIKTILDLPYTEIGYLFGGRDHSTVIHSVNKVEADMAADTEFRGRVLRLRDNLLHSG